MCRQIGRHHGGCHDGADNADESERVGGCHAKQQARQESSHGNGSDQPNQQAHPHDSKAVPQHKTQDLSLNLRRAPSADQSPRYGYGRCSSTCCTGRPARESTPEKTNRPAGSANSRRGRLSGGTHPSTEAHGKRRLLDQHREWPGALPAKGLQNSDSCGPENYPIRTNIHRFWAVVVCVRRPGVHSRQPRSPC